MALAGFFVAVLLTRGQSYWSTTTRPLQLDSDLPLRFQIDLNEADRATLLQIPGVGTDNDRIVSYRDAHGPFSLQVARDSGHRQRDARTPETMGRSEGKAAQPPKKVRQKQPLCA